LGADLNTSNEILSRLISGQQKFFNKRLLNKYRGVALLALAVTSFYASADWKTPREALDQRLVQGEFRIHYTLTGENAFPFDVPPSQRAQQAAVRLNSLVAQIDQANRYYSEQLGLTPPLASARYRDVRSIDVHIIKLEGKKGSTGDAAIVYRYQHFDGSSAALTIALSNQWRPPNLTPNHEVFHAYQYAYTFFKNPWYLEGMARSMETAFRGGEVQAEALPRDYGQLEQVLTRSYDADLFWNRLMYLCDSACSGSTPATAWNDGAYTPHSGFCGGRLVRSTLEQYKMIDKEAAQTRRIDPTDWPENEQRSPKNNPFLLRGLRRAIENECPVHGNSELKAFHTLLEAY
jgi:hypothetical protein